MNVHRAWVPVVVLALLAAFVAFQVQQVRVLVSTTKLGLSIETIEALGQLHQDVEALQAAQAIPECRKFLTPAGRWNKKPAGS